MNQAPVQSASVLRPASRLLWGLAVAGVLASVLVALAALVWSLPRGLDITDESFYLLSYRYPQEYEASFSTFHLLVAKGLGLRDASVLTYRWVSLLFNVAGAAAFGWSLARWRQQAAADGNQSVLLTIGCVVLGSLLAFSIFPRTLSYNALNSLLLLLGAAAVLQALRRGPGGGYWLIGAGIMLGLDLFIKFSTAFLIGVSEVVVLAWYWRRAGGKALLFAGLLLAAGVGLGLGYYFLAIQRPGLWYHNFAQETAIIRNGGYSLIELLPAYLHSFSRIAKFMLYPLGPPLLLLLALAWWWPRRPAPAAWHGPLALALLAGAGLFLAAQGVRRHWYSNAFSNEYETLPLLLALVLLALGVLLAQPARGGAPRAAAAPAPAAQLVPVGCWLFALPFLTTAGTINDIRLNLLIDAGPWFAVLVLLAQARPLRQLPGWVAPALLLVPAGFAAEQVGWGTLFTPYNLPEPMTRQTVPLRTAGFVTPVLVDTATATYFNRLERSLAQAGFRPGDPLLVFYDSPGIAYACGGISPGAPWYFANRPYRNCHALALTHLSFSHACLVLNRPIDPMLSRCLQDQGINFPQNYRLVSEFTSPYKANVPAGSPRRTSVYAPVK